MDLFETLLGLLPLLIAVTAVVAGLWAAGKLFDRWEKRGRASRFTRQLVLLALTIGGLVVVVLTLPIDPGEKGNLLSLIGIVLSAAIALSSTTLLGNLLAGLMVRSLRRLHSGDFVETGEHFGRVTELGLLFTEIQTQDSSLYQVPNMFLVQRPLKVIRSRGTIVTADVSLGYDVPRQRVREALVAAAETVGLEEPFVLVSSLGDFSVVYRVGGLLEDVKTLVSTNSSLRAAMLDQLHEARIEIVSPNFMNTGRASRSASAASKPSPSRRPTRPRCSTPCAPSCRCSRRSARSWPSEARPLARSPRRASPIRPRSCRRPWARSTTASSGCAP
jgi:small conductance mechanosensitive channel